MGLSPAGSYAPRGRLEWTELANQRVGRGVAIFGVESCFWWYSFLLLTHAYCMHPVCISLGIDYLCIDPMFTETDVMTADRRKSWARRTGTQYQPHNLLILIAYRVVPFLPCSLRSS